MPRAPRDPKLTIVAPKIDPQSSQNGAQEPPIATQSDSKHIFKIDRCLKAEFESRGSFQKRSTSKRCCGGVPRSVLNPPQHPLWCCRACKIRCQCLCLSSVIIGSSLSPACAADPSPVSCSKTHQKSTLIFDRFLEPTWSQNRPHLEAKILPKSIQHRIDFLIDFWMRF